MIKKFIINFCACVFLIAFVNFNAKAYIPEFKDAASITIGSELNRAEMMCRQENFNGCIDALSVISTEQIPLSVAQQKTYMFLLGKAYFATKDLRCLKILNSFANNYPSSFNVPEAVLLTGDYYFFKKDWSKALERYKLVDLDILPVDKKNMYIYRKGICMMRRGFYKEASPLFSYLSGEKSYNIIGEYYQGYSDYIENKNSEALQKFENVARAQNNDYAAIMKILNGEKLYPEFYIAQCYFRLKDWEKCSKMAQGVLKRNNLPEEKMKYETTLVYGMSLYELKQYDAAQGHLESYVGATGDNALDDAVYALGVCEYESGNYDAAFIHFSKLIDRHDILAQGAYLYLGQIEAASGNSSAAAIDFEKAYRQSYDLKVAETALYNYVAACSHGGNVPFDTNVKMLERFIESYPSSEYTPAVERHLAMLFYKQGNYEKAVGTINKLREPSKEDLKLKQMIYYAAGASALSQGNANKSVGLLQAAAGIKSDDKELTAQTNIWLGDALYQLGKYKNAESAYTMALKSGRAGNNEEILKYNLGYTKFQLGKYAEAATYFKPIAGSLTALTPEMRRDALVRIADCKYYTGDYSAAKKDYQQLKNEGVGADYASYRYARLLGKEGDLNGKIAELERFEREFSGSILINDVLSDLADAYTSIDNPAKAAKAYSHIVERNPSDPAASKAMLGMAQAYIDAGETSQGIQSFKRILKERPYSAEARLADKELKNYYAENHKLGEYAEFLKSIPGFSLGEKDMARLMFETAQNEYLENNSDISGLKEYVAKFPAGENAAEAYEHLSEYYYSKGDKANALLCYRGLETTGGKDYQTTAWTGIMRTTNNAAQRSEYAGKILNLGGASPEVRDEAEFYVASDRLKSPSGNDRSVARATLERIAGNPFSEAGAMSAVTLAQHLLDTGNADKAASMMEKFTSSGSEEQYWVARGFIVLSDAYKAQGKDYLSQEYLRILRDNYPGKEEDIINLINSRLKK